MVKVVADEYVRFGDVFQLENLASGRSLHSSTYWLDASTFCVVHLGEFSDETGLGLS
jgi:hypothetical protein